MVASAAQLPSSRTPHKQLVARRKSRVQNSLSEHLGKQSKSYCILERLKKKEENKFREKKHTLKDVMVSKVLRLRDQTKHSSSAGRRVTEVPLHPKAVTPIGTHLRMSPKG